MCPLTPDPELVAALPIATSLARTADHDCVDSLPLNFKAKCNLQELLAAEDALSDDLMPPHERELRWPSSAA